MTSRERVGIALEHCEPDRVPWDCNFTIGAYLKLRDYLGLKPKEDARPNYMLTVRPPVELMEELQVDLYYVGLNKAKNAPVFEYGMERYTDEWGITFRKVPNASGWAYYEWASHPLANATVKDLDDYPWPDSTDPVRVAGLEAKVRSLYENTSYALVGKFSESIWEQAWGLRGLEHWYVDLAADPEFAGALMDKLVDISLASAKAGLKACGKYIQIYRLAGDDMGQQHGTLISPRMYRRLVKPHFARLYSGVKALMREYCPDAKLKAHTDGDVYPIIPDYIEMGLDVLNPVQPYVAEMDHPRLKREFGDRLSFHGGIDLQRVMPFGTPEEVRAEAIKTMRALGPGGGYILAPTHYLQADVPPENVIALRDAVLDCGKYPLLT